MQNIRILCCSIFKINFPYMWRSFWVSTCYTSIHLFHMYTIKIKVVANWITLNLIISTHQPWGQAWTYRNKSRFWIRPNKKFATKKWVVTSAGRYACFFLMIKWSSLSMFTTYSPCVAFINMHILFSCESSWSRVLK